MKSKYLIIIFLIVTIGIGFYLFFYNKNSENDSSLDYTVERTEANVNNIDNKENVEESNDSKNEKNEEKAPPVETEVATFTTKIYTKDSGRQNNISITCSSLNDTLVENGATFSFCNTVGQATSAKGYQKAEIFDSKR